MIKEPKRTVKQNVYGNVVGYEGGQRVAEFGDAHQAELIAEIWKNTPKMTINEAIEVYYLTK
jgi:hypothetical protein